jgi:hypothetical protein
MPSHSSRPGDPKTESADHDEGRRKLLTRGLAAAPLIVTLAARPASAQSMGSLGAYEYGTGVDETLPDGEEEPLPDPGDGGNGKGKKRR